jgi:transposase
MSEVEVFIMDPADARRLTERIRITAHNARDAIEKLQLLVEEAKQGNAHHALGYASWTAYLADVLGEEPLRLARDERRQLVGYLAGEGMSTRAIAPIVGVASNKTVYNDLKDIAAAEENYTPPAVEGRDGKIYKPVQNRPDKKPNRRALSESAREAGWDLRKAMERLERIAADDRFTANKELIAPHLRSHLTDAIKVCQDLLDRITIE